MLAMQIAGIGAAGFIVLTVHRAGLPKIFATVGAFFWALGFGIQRGHAEFKRSFAECTEVMR